MYKGPVLWDTTVYVMYTYMYMYVPHELFNRIDQEYRCREHIQCIIIIRVYCLCHMYICVSVVCVCVCMCVCGYVYAVDRLHDLSGETESVYANVVKQPGNPGLVRVKA